MSEISTAVIGLVGAAIGGGVTFGATFLADRTVRAQARDGRLDALAAERRAACTNFLIRVDGYRDQLREVVSLIESGASDEAMSSALHKYNAEWTALAGMNAAVEIAGSPDLAAAALTLRQALGVYSDVIESKLKTGRWPSNAYDGAAGAVVQAREVFVTLARQAASHVPG